MTDVVAEYADTVEDAAGRVWAARACARELPDRWEGWVEFVPLTGAASPVRTPVETTQHGHDAIVQWAAGLHLTYLQGALERALERPVMSPTPDPAPPIFDTPAPSVATAPASGSASVTPILDPYDVYAQSPTLLVEQLAALGTTHLREIVRAYEILPPERAALSSREALVAAIVAAAATAKRAATEGRA